MEGTLIAFRLASYDKDQASELVKRLYGQRTSSHGGKYVYRRKGLLDEIPYVRLIRGVVILRTEDARRVTAFLEGFGAEVHARPSVIIARTTKGRGVRLFEYDNRWHGQAPNKEQYEMAKRELEEGLKVWQS